MTSDAKKHLPEWNVYFDGNFYGKCRRSDREHAGTEIPVRTSFLWDEEEWLIPSVYSCSKGLVADFLHKVPAGKIQAFADKWQLGPDSDCESFTTEQLLRIEQEHPLSLHPITKAHVNGHMLSRSHSTGICWDPVFRDSDTIEAQLVLQHYRLDAAFGWAIWRSYFPWEFRRKPNIKTLSVHLSAEKQAVPGPHFSGKTAGDTISFTYPATGNRHTLTIKENHLEQLDSLHFHDPAKEYPRWFTALGYTITPALPKDCLSLTDCSDGDRPRKRQTVTPPETATEAETAIIGGADGPTVICFSDPKHPEVLYAASAPHFEPVADVEWRMVFHIQQKSDIWVTLI